MSFNAIHCKLPFDRMQGSKVIQFAITNWIILQKMESKDDLFIHQGVKFISRLGPFLWDPHLQLDFWLKEIVSDLMRTDIAGHCK